MLQRFFIHSCLILLFAFTQMGIATHQISHTFDSKQSHQQDKSTHESQCAQCLTYSHAAAAAVANFVSVHFTPADQLYIDVDHVSFVLSLPASYSARAPPSSSQI